MLRVSRMLCKGMKKRCIAKSVGVRVSMSRLSKVAVRNCVARLAARLLNDFLIALVSVS